MYGNILSQMLPQVETITSVHVHDIVRDSCVPGQLHLMIPRTCRLRRVTLLLWGQWLCQCGHWECTRAPGWRGRTPGYSGYEFLLGEEATHRQMSIKWLQYHIHVARNIGRITFGGRPKSSLRELVGLSLTVWYSFVLKNSMDFWFGSCKGRQPKNQI